MDKEFKEEIYHKVENYLNDYKEAIYADEDMEYNIKVFLAKLKEALEI